MKNACYFLGSFAFTVAVLLNCGCAGHAESYQVWRGSTFSADYLIWAYAPNSVMTIR
jgi:hypothetical protein